MEARNMAQALLMPKATAVWLVENTSLTFKQIALFCQLHELEVKGIADGDVAQGIRGMDPVNAGQLTRVELQLGQEDATHQLMVAQSKVEIREIKTKRGPKYTPLSRRQDRPAAIVWLVRNHPELRDSEIIKLVGTTKPTIKAIRDRTHWNSASIQPLDPVTLGLCRQIELDEFVRKAGVRVEKETGEKIGTLRPTSEMIGDQRIVEVNAMPPCEEAVPQVEDVFSSNPVPLEIPQDNKSVEETSIDADSVFAKLSELKQDDGEENPDQSGS
jgi:hypothetical protein